MKNESIDNILKNLACCHWSSKYINFDVFGFNLHVLFVHDPEVWVRNKHFYHLLSGVEVKENVIEEQVDLLNAKLLSFSQNLTFSGF